MKFGDALDKAYVFGLFMLFCEL